MLLTPGVLLAGLSLRSGGFFPDATAAAALFVLVVLAVRLVAVPLPAGRPPLLLVAAAAGVAGLATLQLVSSNWSHAPARAVLEYDRTLLYGSLLVLFASLPRRLGAARLLLGGITIAAAGVCIAALAVWVLPETFPVGPDFEQLRLSWPLGYWNSAGLVGVFAVIFGLHFASDLRSPAIVRVLGAAVPPCGAAVIVLSVSRGAAFALAAGTFALLVARRDRGLLPGLAAAAPATAAAVLVAFDVPAGSETVARADSPRDALLLGACAIGGALVRLLLVAADGRLARASLPAPSRPVKATLALTAAVVISVAFLALDGPHEIQRGYDRFVSKTDVPSTLSAEDRFGRLGNNGRLEHWRVGIDHGFEPARLHGSGAGTYQLLWAEDRESAFNVLDAHSLYVEVLSELGLLGALALAALLAGLLGGLAGRARRGEAAWAALLAGAVAWAVRAGYDWDWEMPAVTAWVFAAGGLALAFGLPRGVARPSSEHPLGRAVAALAVVALALVPVAVYRSQTRLNDAVTAFRAGDCRRAIDAALASTRALHARPEPFEVLSWCDVRRDRDDLAQQTIAAAVQRDPGNWELRYDQALVRAVAGGDPRSALRAAQRRNPLEPLVIEAARRFTAANRRSWRRTALRSRLPLPPRGRALPTGTTRDRR